MDQTLEDVISIEMAAGDLPEQLLAKLSEPPRPDQRFTVTISPALTESEKLRELRALLDEGLADLDEGRMLDAELLFADLRTRCVSG